MRASVGGCDADTAQAEHVRQPTPEHARRCGEPAAERGIRELGQRAGERLDLHEVAAGSTDAFEVLLDLVHRLGERRRVAPVELLGDEDVLGHGDRVLQHPVDVDDVDADELAPALDLLRRDVAEVGDELEGEIGGRMTRSAGTEIRGNGSLLGVKRAVHGDRGLGRGGDDVAIGPRSPRQEGSVALDLDELEVPRSLDDLLQETRCRRLRVAEGRPVEAHVLRVAPDVRNQKHDALTVHSARS